MAGDEANLSDTARTTGTWDVRVGWLAGMASPSHCWRAAMSQSRMSFLCESLARSERAL